MQFIWAPAYNVLQSTYLAETQRCSRKDDLGAVKQAKV